MCICLGPRDPDTKPSRGRLCVYKTKAITRFAPCKRRGSKVINEKPKLRRGCPLLQRSSWRMPEQEFPFLLAQTGQEPEHAPLKTAVFLPPKREIALGGA